MKTINSPISKHSLTSTEEARALLLKPELDKRNKMRRSIGLCELSHADYIKLQYGLTLHNYLKLPLNKKEITRLYLIRSKYNNYKNIKL